MLLGTHPPSGRQPHQLQMPHRPRLLQVQKLAQLTAQEQQPKNLHDDYASKLRPKKELLIEDSGNEFQCITQGAGGGALDEAGSAGALDDESEAGSASTGTLEAPWNVGKESPPVQTTEAGFGRNMVWWDLETILADPFRSRQVMMRLRCCRFMVVDGLLSH